MDDRGDERKTSERLSKSISEVFSSSGAHQATEARMNQAWADIAFAIFLFFVSVVTFNVGMSEQARNPFDAGVIKLLAAVPFLGGAWRMHLGHKAFRDRSRALQAKADQIARKSSEPGH